MQYEWFLIAGTVLAVALFVYQVIRRRVTRDVPMGKTRSGSSSCPDVSDNILPACEMERRRPEAGRTYCKRGVCGKGLKAVPDPYTAYMICVPEGKSVDEACPFG